MELTTNSIQGTVRFTNQNPEILALLDLDPWDYDYVYVNSTSPAGYSASTSTLTYTHPWEYTFEMLVEAGAGGDAGVTYGLTARLANMSLTASGVTVRKRSQQPNPTVVTLEQCIGVVRFIGGTDDTCTTRRRVNNVWGGPIDGFTQPDPQGAVAFGYAPGGYHQNTTFSYSVGNNYGWRTVDVNVPCDEIVTICLPEPPPPPPPPPPPAPGGLTGPWEVIGEPAKLRIIDFWGTVYQSIWDDTPLAPVDDPSSWWSISGLPGGQYGIRTSAYLRTGRDAQAASSGQILASVISNQTTPVSQEIDGQVHYPFVMQPSYMYGSIQLVDPYVSQHPGARSALQALYFGDEDSDADGFPDCLGCGTVLNTAGSSGGYNSSLFPGTFNASTGQLMSVYEQVLLSPYNEPAEWSQSELRLYFDSSQESTDPTRFVLGELSLQQAQNSAQLAAGERFRVDHEYCFNDIALEYWTTQGRFYLPQVQVQGSFMGDDWRGQSASYQVSSGHFTGAPLDSQTAAARGTVNLSLPQGTYTLAPSAMMINASGQANYANFSPISMELGCGQRFKVVPPLTVAISPMPGCAPSSSATVAGVVRSSPAQVGRVWYRLNGGPEVTLCQSCGTDPSFSFTVPLQACGNSVEVFAFTDGMPEPAMGYQQLIWDDPANGPSCSGAYCVGQPPVARCTNVTLPVGPVCGAVSASINDGSFDPDADDTVTCVQSPVGPYAEGSRRVTLTCTDSTGLTSSCEAQVTVRDAIAPTIQCPESVQTCPPNGGTTSGVTASDNCGTAPTVKCTTTGTQATCTATDGSGNHATCSFACSGSGGGDDGGGDDGGGDDGGGDPNCINIRLRDFNLFLLEDYSGGHDVQGKVAAGGNVTMTDFAVGSGLPDSSISQTLVAGGNLTLSRGGVWGDAWYGGTYSADPSVTFVRGAVSQGTPVDFAARGDQLRTLSSQLAALVANGTTVRESWGGVMLSGSNPSVNVFDVQASDFTGAALLSISAPAGSLAILNIHGASAQFTGFGHTFDGGIDQHGVLFNFVDATSITAHGYGFWGTVLAPQAAIDFSNGSFDGGIYARSFTGNAEGHINPLNNRSICPAGP